MHHHTSLIEPLEQRIAPAVFIVTTTNDTGLGSFRQAILDANAQTNQGSPDEIRFNIPGSGVHTIRPLAPLPAVTDPVIIDGYSQPASSPNTLALGSDAVLLIELDGSLTPNDANDHGLRIDAGGSTIRGLIINHFNSYGIAMIGGDGNTVAGNWVGPNQDGLTAPALSTFGILISDSSNNLIGGSSPAARNVIAGNQESLEIIGNAAGTGSENNRIQGNYFGIGKDGVTPLGNKFALYTQSPRTFIGGPNPGEGNVIANTANDAGIYVNTSFAVGTVIQGNIIGLDATGTLAMGNGDYGIVSDAPSLTIGGNSTGARNIISSNGGGGINLNGTDFVIRGNFIGTDITGTLARPNVGHGIELAYGSAASAQGTIGGIAPGEGNLVAFNTLDGVSITVVSGSSSVSIRGNSIHDNGDLGIDLGDDGVTANDPGDTDVGANGFQNFPLLTSATRTATFGNVSGTLQSTPLKSYFIDFYASSAADPTGFGEGRIFLGDIGITTDATGAATFNFSPGTLPAPGSRITAVATDASGNTSEFSAAILLSTQFIWDGSAGDQNWFTSANWTPEGVPGTVDMATLDIPSTISLTSSTTVASFTQANGTFTSPTAVTLTVSQGFIWSGGEQAGAGVTSIAPTGHLELNGIEKILNQRTIEILGNARASSSGIIVLTNGATINNHGLFEVESGADFLYPDDSSAAVAFNNLTGAIFRKTITADVTEFTGANLSFNSSGTVDVRVGTLRLSSNGNGSSGDFDIAAAATLEFAGGTHLLSGVSTLRGGGTFAVTGATMMIADGSTISGIGTAFQVSSGILSVSGTVSVAPESLFVQGGGTLTGPGTLAVQGSYTWSSGTQSGSGLTRIDSGGTLVMSGSSAKTLDGRMLDVFGVATVIGAGGLSLINAAAITNRGIFDVSSDADFIYPSSGGAAVAFNNQLGATFRKSAGTDVTNFAGSNFAFNNAGLVEVKTGTLSFDSGYLQSEGTLALRGGSVATSSSILLTGGELVGLGSIGGNLLNTGATVRPGAPGSTGTLNITGDYTQTSAGIFAVDLAGVLPGQFDVLSVSGIVTLGGTLELTWNAGFTPTADDQFRIVSSAGNPGLFSTLSGQVTGLSQIADAAGLVIGPVPTGAPDLLLLSSNGLTTATPGAVLTYNLTFRNDGPRGATGVTITELLPEGTMFNPAASTPGWIEASPGSGVFTFFLGALSPGGAGGSIAFAVTVNSIAASGLDQIVNTTSILDDGLGGADPTPANNNVTESDTLDAAPDLRLSVQSDFAVARRGGTIGYHLHYTNAGNQNASEVILTQILPAGASFVSAGSTVGWTETLPGSGIYRLPVGDLPADAHGYATFTVRFASSLPSNLREAAANFSVEDNLSNGVDPTPLDNSVESRARVYQGVYILAPGVPVRLKDAPPSTVRVFDIATGAEAFRFDAYESNYRDSVRLAVGDLNGDGFDDIITAKRTGTGQVRVFDGLTGVQFGQIDPFDGLTPKTRGAFVASGDVTGDQRDDIVVGSALGGGTVKIYDGVTGSLLNTYQPFGTKFTGGVRVAVGDLNGDGRDDVVVSQGSGGSRVKAYDSFTTVVKQDFRVGPKGYRGGIYVATGDFDGDGRADILTGRDIGGSPRVETFSGLDHHRISSILAFNAAFQNGVRVAAADVNLDGIADIIATSGTKNRSRVLIFDGSTSNLMLSFAAFPDYPDSSLFVASSTTLPTSG